MKLFEFLENEKIYEFAKISYDRLTVIDERREKRLFGDKKIRTAVFFLIPYYTGDEKGNLSKYARARDYHLYIKELEKRAGECLDAAPVMCADTSPIAEVSGACLSGLGCAGENALIINRRYGSYVFIGEMFFELDEKDTFFDGVEEKHSPQKCLMCHACKKACPTGAIYDRTKCISYINQKKKVSPEEEKIIKASGMVWGCDKCQERCPMNKGEITPIPFFKQNLISSLDEETLDRLISDGEFDKRAYAWRGENTVRRNIKIIKEL